MAPNQPRPTKAQRREAARAKAKAAREEQLRRERRRTITRRSLIGAGGLAVVGAVGYVVYDYFQNRTTAADFPAVGTTATAKADRRGVPGPALSDGSWTYGTGGELDAISPDVPVLDIFFDYSCPHCAEFEELHGQEISTLLSEGKVTLVLHPSKVVGNDWTDKAMNAMGVVLSKAPEQSLAFHTALMQAFTQAVQAQDTSMLSTETLVAAATEAQVPTSVSDEFEDAVDSNTYEEWVELGNEALKSAKVDSTPSVFLDGTKLDLADLQSETAITEQVEAASPATSTATEPAPTDGATATEEAGQDAEQPGEPGE